MRFSFRSSALGFSLPSLFLGIVSVAATAQSTAPAVAIGSVNVGSSGTGTVTFTFTGSTTVTAVNVLTQGSTTGEFQRNSSAAGTCAATTYAANATCTVGVKFTPTFAGGRYGAVTLSTASGSQAGGVGYVSAQSNGGLLAFPTVTAIDITGNSSNTSFYGLAVDAAGRVFVGDSFNNQTIYRETISGATANVTTIVSGQSDTAALALDGAGNLYVVDNSGILYLYLYNSANDSYTLTSTNIGQQMYSDEVAVDGSGNVYFYNASTIIKETYVSPGQYTQSTLGSFFGGTTGLAVDALSNVYVADNNAIYKETWNGSSYSQSTFASFSGKMRYLAVDPAGNVYGNDGYNLYRFVPNGSGGSSITVMSSVTAGPIAASPNGTVYQADGSSNPLHSFSQAAINVSTSSSQGGVSAQVPVTVQNIGNASLTANSLSAVAPAQVGSSSVCSATSTLAFNGSCVLDVQFAPTSATTPQTGTVTFGSAYAGSVTVTVNGTVSGAAAKLNFSINPTSGITAGGNAGSAKVALQDANGNAVTTSTAAVTLTVTGPGSYSQAYTVNAVNGTATFDLSGATLTKSGTYTYTATSTGLTQAQSTASVVAAAATSLTATPASTTPYLGAPDTITVTAFDTYGNAANSSDVVTLTTTDSTATGTGTVTLSGGTASKAITFNTLGTFTVTATDTTNGAITASTTASITVVADPSYTVTVATDPASGTAGNCTNQAVASPVTDASCSLRDALAATSALGVNGSSTYTPTINFGAAVYGQTITIASQITVVGNFSLVGPGSGSNAVTLSGGGTSAFITDQSAGAVIKFSGLTFSSFKNASAGGGVLAVPTSGGPTVTVSNSIFKNNSATTGGALYGYMTASITGSTFDTNASTFGNGGAIAGNGAALTIVNSLFKSNSASASGGAVYNTASVSTTNSAFLSNTSGSNGGAVYGIALNFSTSTFNSNTASVSGGAADGPSGATIITNSSFDGNKASGTGAHNGGALYGAVVNITSSSFTNNQVLSTNSSALGGAVYSSATFTVVNAFFSGNNATGTASANGGATWSSAASTQTNVTHVGNSVTGGTTRTGGAVYSGGASTAYNVTVTGNTGATIGGGVYINNSTRNWNNSVVTGNSSTSTYPDFYSTVSGASGNYINNGSATTCAANCTPMLSALVSSNLMLGASFTPNTGYTLPAQTPMKVMLPLPGSPLIATGNLTVAYNTVDARGLSRTTLYNGTAYLDIGAAQTSYTAAFVAQPVSTVVGANVTGLVPATSATASGPTVQFYESGTQLTAAPYAGTPSLKVGALSGSPTYAANTYSSGLYTINPLSFSTVQSNDLLYAYVTSSGTIPVGSSNVFSISNPISFSTAPPQSLALNGNAGTVVVKITKADGTAYTTADTVTLTVTGPSSYSQTYTQTNATGTISFNLASVSLATAGTYTYTVSDAAFTTATAVATEVVASGAQALGSFTITGTTSPHIGYSSTYTVTALDTTGAVFTGYTGTVNVTDNDPLATVTPTSHAFTAGESGVTTVSVSWNTGGTHTLTVTDSTTGIKAILSTTTVDDYVWVLTPAGATSKLQETGGVIGTTSTANTTATYGAVAFDNSGNAWSVTSGTNALLMSTRGNASPTTFSGTGGLNAPVSVAVDGAGVVWVANSGNSSISVFTNAGVAKSGSTGFATSVLSGPSQLAIDNTGGVWVTNKTGNTITHTFGAATPVTTPQVTAVKNATVGVAP